MAYQPPQAVLEKYADVLVNFALGHGKGIKKGDVVRVSAKECAKPLYAEVCRAVWRAGGNVISAYQPDNDSAINITKSFFDIATDEQLDYFAQSYWRSQVDEADHWLAILGEADPRALEGADPKKIMRSGLKMQKVWEWRSEKENRNAFSWTLGLYGTPAMAKEAGLDLEEYWQQITNACYLDMDDPLAKWRETTDQIQELAAKMTALPIDKLHVTGEDADLWITLGEKRAWRGGSGANIPSFEIFTSPDWRGTNGWIRFNQPLYRYGNLVEGIRLEFKDGLVTKASATKNEAVLTEMVAAPNADKVGEFSLTDSRFSRITKFMAETLYDENMGGRYGNTHIAVGKSYHDCYDGDPSTLSKEQWAELGFNDSSVHTDIISTADRTVTATMQDGSERVIYQDGKFVI